MCQECFANFVQKVHFIYREKPGTLDKGMHGDYAVDIGKNRLQSARHIGRQTVGQTVG